MFQNTRFCLDNGVVGDRDVDRLLDKLTGQDRTALLAQEFGMRPVEMAPYSFDAGLAFMRFRLLDGDQPGVLYTPPPVPDNGWDVMSVLPEERDEFYEGVCVRLSRALGVPPVILDHGMMTPDQIVTARGNGSVQYLVDGLRRYQLP